MRENISIFTMSECVEASERVCRCKCMRECVDVVYERVCRCKCMSECVDACVRIQLYLHSVSVCSCMYEYVDVDEWLSV